MAADATLRQLVEVERHESRLVFPRGIGKAAGELVELAIALEKGCGRRSFELLTLGVGEFLRQHVAGAHALGEARDRLRVAGDDGRDELEHRALERHHLVAEQAAQLRRELLDRSRRRGRRGGRRSGGRSGHRVFVDWAPTATVPASSRARNRGPVTLEALPLSPIMGTSS